MARRRAAKHCIWQLELNTNNDEEILNEAANVRRAMFLRCFFVFFSICKCICICHQCKECHSSKVVQFSYSFCSGPSLHSSSSCLLDEEILSKECRWRKITVHCFIVLIKIGRQLVSFIEFGKSAKSWLTSRSENFFCYHTK